MLVGRSGAGGGGEGGRRGGRGGGREKEEEKKEEDEEETGNSKKTYSEMIREFLNIVYSSLYMGAGASCSTSVDLVKYIDHKRCRQFLNSNKFSS